jgi:hypothetical protein
MSQPRRHRLRDHLGRFTSPTGNPRPGHDRRTDGDEPRPGNARHAAGDGPRPGNAGLAAGRPGGRLRAVRDSLRRAPGLVLAALRGELARRLYRLAVVAVALGAAVVLLYQHGDSPAALGRTVQAASAASAAPSAAAPSAPSPSAGPSASTAPPASAAASARPAQPPRETGATRPTPGTPERAAPPAARPVRPSKPAEAAAAWYAAREHLGASQVRPLQQDKVSNREVRVLVLADRGNGNLDTALVTVRRDAKGGWSVP